MSKKEIASGQKAPRNDNVVEQAKKDMLEIDLAKQRQEVREGVEAGDKLAKIETKEELRLVEIGNKYLGGMSYERERVIGKAQAHLQQAVTGIIEAGKCFLAMKEAEKHGDWQEILEKRIGISQPTGWRFMAIARKFKNIHAVNELKATFTEGIGKLYALLNVPDEELAEFDETGMFRGATVEDINKMSVSQFRKLVMEKEDWKAKARQLELEVQTKYDTTSRYTKKIKELERDNKALKEKVSLSGISGEEADVLKQFESLKIQARGVIRMIETADARKLTEELKIELEGLAQYIHERAEMCQSRIMEMTRGGQWTADRESTEKEFYKTHGEDED